MRSDTNRNSKGGFDELLKMADIGTRRITDNQSGRKMNELGSIFFHLFRNVFSISSGAPPAMGVSDNFDVFFSGIYGKCADSFR